MSLKKQLKKLGYKSRALQIKLTEAVTDPLRKRNAADLGIFRPLPIPDPMTVSLTEALMNRHTDRQFAEQTISDQMLSNLLWATDGINRKDGRRTTPSPFNWQGIEIYVVKSNGVWLWEPERTSLRFIKGGDLRTAVAPVDPLVSRAPVHLVYVANIESTKIRATESASEFLSFIRSDRFKRIGTWTQTSVRNAVMIDVGAKVQACYLACAAMGLGTVCRITLDRGAAREALSLKPRQIVIASQSVGHTL